MLTVRKIITVLVCTLTVVAIAYTNSYFYFKDYAVVTMTNDAVRNMSTIEIEPIISETITVPTSDKPHRAKEILYVVNANNDNEVNTTLEVEPVDDIEIIDEAIDDTTSDIVSPPEFISYYTHSIGDYCELPDLPTNVKSFTDYRCYNLTNTPHYRLQQVAWTDEWGLRRLNDDYIVALGTYFTTDIGDRFEVTLDTGRTFTVILGDNKADVDTDDTNRYKPCAYYTDYEANVLEFIVDLDTVPSWVWNRGSIDCIDEFSGNIVSMQYIGRDDSTDWDSYM